MARSYYTHDGWLEQQADKGIPLYQDCYIEDLRTVELGHWDLRDCSTAFIKFTDMEGITEARVQEIPPGGALRPFSSASTSWSTSSKDAGSRRCTASRAGRSETSSGRRGAPS